MPNALAAQAPLTDALSQTIARLTLHVSHFHQVYDLGVARGIFTAGGRAYYDRDVTANSLPDLTTIGNVIDAAAKIATGEAARRAAEGSKHIPMALPSAAEVAAVHAEAVAKRAVSEAAKHNTDTQQGELAALYPEAQKLAVTSSTLLSSISVNGRIWMMPAEGASPGLGAWFM